MSPEFIIFGGIQLLALITILWLRFVSATPPPKADTGHADRMWRAGQTFWATGECTSCNCVHFDHQDDCELHAYLGGDPK